ncbi:RPAP1-like protein [Aspergillus stella-maris]|uniref:RPAP1-like protein n=1 Tax=Aspergillus stella-maris TaxID=1810926 RepID=UPI003CCE2FC2
MAFHGERFEVNLDSDGEDIVPAISSTLAIPGVIGEIQERSPAAPPAPPTLKSASGFPAHKRRARPSAFKQRQAQPKAPETGSGKTSSDPQDEKAGIDEQNRQQLASMSDAQLQQEREELMSTIDPSLLERFLRRARIDDDNPAPSSFTAATKEDDSKPSPAVVPAPNSDQTPTPAQKSTPISTQPPKQNSTPTPDDRQPPAIPADLRPAAEFASSSVHFPTPPPSSSNVPPSLDPNSDSFLSDLQTHYFPNITHDPSSLSWLQPPPSDPDDPESNLPPSSAYHPGSSAESIHPSSIRFSLLGTILSPSTSLSLPTNLGLHHHGEDPHAAGYTIPELAILSRSSFPAQRCIAWQVLGRILFRLGKGQFGERGSNLVEGFWEVIEKEGVVSGMLEEAGGSSSGTGPSLKGKKDAADDEKNASGGGKAGGVGRHASAAAWAVEGVWLWQMGGSGDRGVLKPGAVRSQ